MCAMPPEKAYKPCVKQLRSQLPPAALSASGSRVEGLPSYFFTIYDAIAILVKSQVVF